MSDKGTINREADSEKPRVTVRVFIKNKVNKTLILRKDETSKAAGLWETAGGNVDDGENEIGATIREAKVETGLTISPSNLKLQGTFKYPVPISGVGERIVHQYIATIDTDGSDVVIGTDPDDRHDAFMWVSDDELKKLRDEGKLLGNSIHFDDKFEEK